MGLQQHSSLEVEAEASAHELLAEEEQAKAKAAAKKSKKQKQKARKSQSGSVSMVKEAQPQYSSSADIAEASFAAQAAGPSAVREQLLQNLQRVSISPKAQDENAQFLEDLFCCPLSKVRSTSLQATQAGKYCQPPVCCSRGECKACPALTVSPWQL